MLSARQASGLRSVSTGREAKGGEYHQGMVKDNARSTEPDCRVADIISVLEGPGIVQLPPPPPRLTFAGIRCYANCIAASV